MLVCVLLLVLYGFKEKFFNRGEQTQNLEIANSQTGAKSVADAIKPDKESTDAKETTDAKTEEKPHAVPGDVASDASKPDASKPPAETEKSAVNVANNAAAETLTTAVPPTETPKETEKTGSEPPASVTVEKPAESVNPPAKNEETAALDKPIGRFTSTDQIMLRSSDGTNWERIPNGAILYPQQHLLALPTYRPAILLSSGLILQMLGGTQLELLPGDSKSPAGIKIRYGRVAINSAAKEGIQLRIVLGEQSNVLTFVDADTRVGIDVRNFHASGTNPETDGRLMTEIFVTKDRAAWGDGVEKPLELAAPARILLLPQIPSITDHPKDFPKWIVADDPGAEVSDIDRRASRNMLPLFAAETPAQQKLLELADPSQTRQIEVRRLAVKCLGYLGYFDPLVMVLGEPTFKQEWPTHCDWLRDAVNRDPATATAVREALEKRYAPQAANLYRMLWGYTDKDLTGGEDQNLVKSLDDENLAVRVLGIWALKSVTDKDLGYKPDETSVIKRASMVARWEQRQKAKEIRVKTPDKKNGIAVPEPPPASPPASEPAT